MDKEEKRKRDHEYYLRHRQEIIDRAAKWQKDNKEQKNAYLRKWVANKLRADPGFREKRKEWWQTTYRRHRAKLLLGKHTGSVKERAREAVMHALVKGTLIRPDICDACGARDTIQAHHPDYSKPLEVVWLCVFCHGSIHATYQQTTDL